MSSNGGVFSRNSESRKECPKGKEKRKWQGGMYNFLKLIKVVVTILFLTYIKEKYSNNFVKNVDYIFIFTCIICDIIKK